MIFSMLLATTLLGAPETPPPADGDNVLLLRYALLAGGRGETPAPAVAGALGRAELQESLLQWDPDADNEEVRRVFALNHISEISRQASQLPAAGGTSTALFTHADSRFDIEVRVAPGTDDATVAALIRHNGKEISSPRIATRFGQRAIVSAENGPEAPLLFLVLDIRRASAKELGAKGMRFAWKEDLELIDGERIRAPRALTRVNPEYTEAAKAAKVEGQVLLRTILSADGKIEDIEVLRGLDHGLTEAAVAAVRQWQFAPATLEGKPVRVIFMLMINFALPEADRAS